MSASIQSKEQLVSLLSEIGKKHFNVSPDRLKPEVLLREDLELDSIDLFDMVSHLEKASAANIDVEGLAKVKSVQDLVDALWTALQH